MCLALLDARAWTAGELRPHRVAPPPRPSTCTAIGGGLLVERARAVNGVVQLADPSVATF
jgi:hypothetical protein